MGRGQAAKENFLLARFLFGTEQGTIPEDGAGEEEELGYLPGGGGDCASDKGIIFCFVLFVEFRKVDKFK